MTSLKTHQNLHALLVKQKENQSFEQTSTHFIEAWSHFVILSNLESKSFPLATRDLFTWLSGDQNSIHIDTVMSSGCPSQKIAEDLMTILEEGCYTYIQFAKKLATLSIEDLNCLFEHFYYERDQVNRLYKDHEQILSVDDSICDNTSLPVSLSNTTQKPKPSNGRAFLQVVRRCVQWFRCRRTKWY